jgi:hypothetical protein
MISHKLDGLPAVEIAIVPEKGRSLAVADRQVVAPVKARQRAIETRRARHGVHHERGTAYLRWRNERREALLAGPHRDAAYRLIGFLENMELRDGAALIRLVEKRQWRSADLGIRLEILSLIDGAIIALREKHGMPPFDDSLPDELANVFLAIREALA